MNFEIVELHKFKEYMSEAADVLNDEWPRSKTARLHSLEKSCDQLPCCLVLLSIQGGRKEVIGHSMLSPVYQMEKTCFVESVVVRRELRGKGYGRDLMNGTEDWARKHGYTVMYLTTIDKQGFYSRLGYTYTDTPILSVGANAHRLTDDLAKLFLGSATKETSKTLMKDELTSNKASTAGRTRDVSGKNSVTTPQKSASDGSSKGGNSSSSTSAAPSPPPPPPPPPPPMPSMSNKNNSRVVQRLDPSATTWMKKSL